MKITPFYMLKPPWNDSIFWQFFNGIYWNFKRYDIQLFSK